MQFQFPWKNNSKSNESNEQDQICNQNDCSIAIQIIKKKRIELGFSIDQLAYKTKISPYVLNSIESGLINALPEKTYLKSMIKKLESELKLEENSLNGLKKIEEKSPKRKFKIIPNGKTILLQTWQGSLVYLISILILILCLNRYQRYLSIINSQTTYPLEIKGSNSK